MINSAKLVKLFLELGPDKEYFHETSKSLFIAKSPAQEAAECPDFEAEGLQLKFVCGSKYLGFYLWAIEKLEAWVRPKVEAWAHRVHTLGKISKRHPQLSYYSLGVSLQFE